MFSKSSALAASERSIAESMLGGDWDCSAEGKCHGVEYKCLIEICIRKLTAKSIPRNYPVGLVQFGRREGRGSVYAKHVLGITNKALSS